jgi:hypothetical protein
MLHGWTLPACCLCARPADGSNTEDEAAATALEVGRHMHFVEGSLGPAISPQVVSPEPAKAATATLAVPAAPAPTAAEPTAAVLVVEKLDLEAAETAPAATAAASVAVQEPQLELSGVAEQEAVAVAEGEREVVAHSVHMEVGCCSAVVYVCCSS